MAITRTSLFVIALAMALPVSATEIFDINAGTYTKLDDGDTSIQIKETPEYTHYLRGNEAAESGATQRPLTEKDRRRAKDLIRSIGAEDAAERSKGSTPVPNYSSRIDWNAPLRGRDANGCTDGRRMVYVKQGGFLGMGGKEVPIGCMTQAELNRWNIEQQNNRRPVFVPQPGNTYPSAKTCYGNRVGNQTYLNCF